MIIHRPFKDNWQINSTCQVCGRPCNKGDNYGKDGCSECANENNEG